MKRMALLLGVPLTVGVVVGAIGSRLLHAQQEPVKRTVLLRAELAGCKGREALLVLGEMARGASSRPSRHNGNEFVYVLEGSVRVKARGKEPVTLKPGDTFQVPPGQVHQVHNASSTAPTKALVFYVVGKGEPLSAISIPVKEGEPERSPK